jgi:hypothetical protein
VASEDDVRRIASALPETSEQPSHSGSPGFKVRGKLFLRIRSEAEGGLVCFVADLGVKEALLASDPQTYFTTPHSDNHPSVLINLPAIGLTELQEMITDSWRLKAPKRLVAQWEDS